MSQSLAIADWPASRHHPQWTDVAGRCLSWSGGGGTTDGAGDLFELGEWLTRHP